MLFGGNWLGAGVLTPRYDSVVGGGGGYGYSCLSRGGTVGSDFPTGWGDYLPTGGVSHDDNLCVLLSMVVCKVRRKGDSCTHGPTFYIWAVDLRGRSFFLFYAMCRAYYCSCAFLLVYAEVERWLLLF